METTKHDDPAAAVKAAKLALDKAIFGNSLHNQPADLPDWIASAKGQNGSATATSPPPPSIAPPPPPPLLGDSDFNGNSGNSNNNSNSSGPLGGVFETSRLLALQRGSPVDFLRQFQAAASARAAGGAATVPGSASALLAGFAPRGPFAAAAGNNKHRRRRPIFSGS